jgi:hypothetical protein
MRPSTSEHVWVRHANEALDLGPQTPAFPHRAFRVIRTRADAESLVGPDHTRWMLPAQASLDPLYDVMAELNTYPKLVTTHAVGGVDDRYSDPEFEWAACRAYSSIIILPRDVVENVSFVPDLSAARDIGADLCQLLLEKRDLARVGVGVFVWFAPVLMKFGTTGHSWPAWGYGSQLTVEGYAARPRRAGERWQMAMRLVADHL